MTRDSAKSIFLDLLEIPDAEHDRYIYSACSGDQELINRVRSLLRAHRTADDFLGGVDRTPDLAEHEERSMPNTIGPYRVIDRLGVGGFGTVYLCEQDEPIKRRVAIKVLRDHGLSPTAMQRFEEERILLSRMNHPGIARVLDAGRTESGSAYIVMEHIDGSAITSYCDLHRLGTDARLRLCVQACRAVQHAHQKGVIHRDIKPSNVLVCEIDGQPSVKIIDFGVSKAFVDELKPTETITRSMQIVGTPQYMSPEQASTGTQSLDTRSDVYTLGVLLYELTTGLQPFDPERLRSASATQLERMIREIDPVRPSMRFVQCDETRATQIAGQRSTTRSHLANALRGELDWITMRAMEKDPDRRYPTANALAEDLLRSINGEPVDAGPPSRLYRTRRLVARHRVPAILALLILLSLMAITAMSLVHASQLRKANTQIGRTLENREQIIRFTEDMLTGIDPAQARGRDNTLLIELLDQAATRLDEGFSTDAEVDARLRVMVGGLYRNIGEFEQARPYLEQAVARASEALGDEHQQTINARISLGSIYAELSQYEAAKAELERAIGSARTTLGTTHPLTMTARSALAAVDNSLGHSEAAIEQYRTLLEDRIHVLGDLHEDTMAVRNNLAHALMGADQHEESRSIFESVLAHQLDTLGDDHPHTLRTRTNLALLYADLGIHDRSIEMNRDILAQKQRVLGDRHPSVLVSMVNLASVLEHAQSTSEARTLLESALAISVEDLGESHQYTLTIHNNLAGLLRRADQIEAAALHQRAAYEGCLTSFGIDHPLSIRCAENYVQLLLMLNDPASALPIAESSHEAARGVFGEQDPRYLPQLKCLTRCYIHLEETDAARVLADQLVLLTTQLLGRDSQELQEAIELRDSIGSS